MKYLNHYQMDCGAWRMHPWWSKVNAVFLVMLSKNVNIIIVRHWCPNMQGCFLKQWYSVCVGPPYLCREILGQRKSTFGKTSSMKKIFRNSIFIVYIWTGRNWDFCKLWQAVIRVARDIPVRFVLAFWSFGPVITVSENAKACAAAQQLDSSPRALPRWGQDYRLSTQRPWSLGY